MQNNPIESSSAMLNQSIALILSADQKKPLTSEQLTPAKRINEQEGYAVLIHRALKGIDGALASRFERDLKPATEAYKKNHGDLNLFKIADRLMRQYTREKLISQETYRKIRDDAFGKSQLDSNRTLLSSVRAADAKSGDTPVRALSTFYRKIEENPAASAEEIAQFRASEAAISVEKWREKRRSAATHAATIDASNKTEISSAIPNGFLWKPQSDSDGKLVVLLPASLNTDTVASLTIRDSKTGEILETGRFAGVGNGSRLHFRFSKSGENFPDGAVVEISLFHGEPLRIAINETAQRTEKA